MHGLMSVTEAVEITGTPAELSLCSAAKTKVEEQGCLHIVVIKSFDLGWLGLNQQLLNDYCGEGDHNTWIQMSPEAPHAMSIETPCNSYGSTLTCHNLAILQLAAVTFSGQSNPGHGIWGNISPEILAMGQPLALGCWVGKSHAILRQPQVCSGLH